MSASTKPSKLVPTTVSKEELGKLVSEWRPYCLMLAFYFKAFRYMVIPMAIVCLVGWVIDVVPWYGPVVLALSAGVVEFTRVWFVRKIPFYWAPNAQ